MKRLKRAGPLGCAEPPDRVPNFQNIKTGLVITVELRRRSKGKEYCYYEKFEAKCQDDEVIIMVSALYGRMRFGRCVRTNFGFIGCMMDVLNLLDRRCSGRSSCSVDVVEPTFDNIRPCNIELKSYLEAEYQCNKGNKYIGQIDLENIRVMNA